MTAITSISPSPLACWLISLYQRHVSPRKGFRCAYRVRKGRDSCSAFAKRVIARFGLLPGVRLLRRRFERCRGASLELRQASQVLDYQTPGRERKDDPRRDASWSAADCFPGCDVPLPTDACDVTTSLAGAAGDAVSGAASAATGCADGAACDVGCCDVSL